MTSRIIVMCSESSKAQVMKNHAYNTVNIDEKEGAKTNKKVRKPSCQSKYQIDFNYFPNSVAGPENMRSRGVRVTTRRSRVGIRSPRVEHRFRVPHTVGKVIFRHTVDAKNHLASTVWCKRIFLIENIEKNL